MPLAQPSKKFLKRGRLKTIKPEIKSEIWQKPIGIKNNYMPEKEKNLEEMDNIQDTNNLPNWITTTLNT